MMFGGLQPSLMSRHASSGSECKSSGTKYTSLRVSSVRQKLLKWVLVNQVWFTDARKMLASYTWYSVQIYTAHFWRRTFRPRDNTWTQADPCDDTQQHHHPNRTFLGSSTYRFEWSQVCRFFNIGEVLFKYAIMLSLFQKECKNFILKPILRIEILLCKLIKIFRIFQVGQH